MAATGLAFSSCTSTSPSTRPAPRLAIEPVIMVQGQPYRALSIQLDSFPSNALFEMNGKSVGRAPTVVAVAAHPDETFVEPVFLRAQVGESDIDRAMRSPANRGAVRNVVWVTAGFRPGDRVPLRVVATQDGMEY